MLRGSTDQETRTSKYFRFTVHWNHSSKIVDEINSILISSIFYLCYILIDVVVQFFLCFSLIKNTSRIMDTKVPASAITSINGMRVMSMWWVILGHVYGFQTVSAMSKYCSLHKAIFDRLLTIVWVWFCSTSPCFCKKFV